VKRLVVALGGNALLRRGEPGSMANQRRNLSVAAKALADLVMLDGLDLVITHGNGPQVGYLALQSELAAHTVPPVPLDVLGAESQGQIGYLLTAALRAAMDNAEATLGDRGTLPGRIKATLRSRGVRDVAAVVTSVLVERTDPAFADPSKFIGPVYAEAEARSLAAERGWTVKRDGTAWRRVVPSPMPISIVEAPAIWILVKAGVLVVASGGGGVPVAAATDGSGMLEGLEAVIDKDLAAAVLAEAVGADGLLLLTDVDAVYEDFGGNVPRRIARLSLAEAEAGLAAGAWPAGSMGPKILALTKFLRSGGDPKFAAIGSLDAAADIVAGRAGTIIVG
jgi:carbamate kinase